MKTIVFDLETSVDYTERGWQPFTCMSYGAFEGGDVKLVDRETGCDLMRSWLSDPEVTLGGWSLAGDMISVIGTLDGRLDGPAMRAVLGAYDDNRIRCGMEREVALDIALGEREGRKFSLLETARRHGIEIEGEKNLPKDAQALLDKCVPLAEWPREIYETVPVRFRYGELEGLRREEFPPEFIDYALEDVVVCRQIMTNQGSRRARKLGAGLLPVPDERTQAIAAFFFRLAEAQGMRTDAERARRMMAEFGALEQAAHKTLEKVVVPCPTCLATGHVKRKKPPKRKLPPLKCKACAGNGVAPLRRPATRGPKGGKYKAALQRRVLQTLVYAELGESAGLTDSGQLLEAQGKLPPPGDVGRTAYIATDAKVLARYIATSGAQQLAEVVDGCRPDESFLAAARCAGVEGLADAFAAAGATSKTPVEASGVVAFQTAQRLQKYQSTYLRHFLTDRVIRPRHTVQVSSGRASVSRWPYMQAPRSGGIRECIVPPAGHTFTCYDLSQIELVAIAKLLDTSVLEWARRARISKSSRQQAYMMRGLARLGYVEGQPFESSLARELRAGKDCHVLVACHEALLNMDYAQAKAIHKRAKKKAAEDLTPLERRVLQVRQLTKVANYGFPGGMSARTFVAFAAAQGVTVDVKLAQKLRQVWLDTWPEIALYFKLVSDLARRDPCVVVCGGIPVRRPCVFTLESCKPRGAVLYTAAANHGFQSLAALGAKDAMRKLLWELYVGFEPPTVSLEDLAEGPAAGIRVRSEYFDSPRVLSPLYRSRPVAFVHDEFLIATPNDSGPAGAALSNTMVRGLTRRALRGYPVEATGHTGLDSWSK